ncbi:MAG: hypothetical protein ACRCTJ_05720 [Brevinema sp.]
MNKILLILLVFPVMLFAQTADHIYKMTPAGWIFLILSWTGIIMGNIFFFRRLLKKDKD